MHEYEPHSLQETAPKESSMDTRDDDDVVVMDGIMQYAYGNNLVTDHRLSSFSLASLFGPLIQSTIPDAREDGFTDHSHLAELEIPTPSPWEKPSTTSNALRLIQEVRHPLAGEEARELTREACESAQVARLKLELPILKTDNEWDMRAFERENVARRAAVLGSLRNHRLPLDPQNLEDGEGMELSSKLRARCDDLVRMVEGERLAVTKDSARYLVSQRRHDFTREDHMSFLIEEVSSDKHPLKDKKLTPPVSPKLGKNFFAANFDPGPLPVPSDSSSLLSDNFHAIEEAMLGEHQDLWSENTSPIREFLQEDFTVADKEELLDYARQSLEDFKVDVPLLIDEAPELPGPSGPGAFRDFVRGAMDLDPEFERACLQNFSDDGLQEQLEEAAGKAEMAVEQEELDEVDATARVQVPAMDFSRPGPEWTRLHNDARAMFQWIQGGIEHLFRAPRWPVHRTAESKLVWRPLNPEASSALLEETVDAGGPLIQKFLNPPDPSETVTSLNLVQRRNLPAAFEDLDMDEEIEVEAKTKSNPGDKLMGIVRKRNMIPSDGGAYKKPRTSAKPSSRQTPEKAVPSLLAGDSPGASARLLANYMEVHAPKKKPWTHSKYFGPQKTVSVAVASQKTILEDTLTTEGDEKTLPDSQTAKQPAPKQNTPCPSLQHSATPLTVFISIKIPARLLWAVQGLIPDLNLIERDYDGYNTSVWRPGSVARTEVVPDLANDADISVSPNTGLIITSMIRIRQKPRSGATKSMVHARVEKASVRYERLFILIGGEGGCDDTLQNTSASDLVAIQELQGFSSGLDCSIQIHFVGGGDKTLANWVASCISRYGLAQPDMLTGLIDVETLWELFLRRAGLNVFAAQVVVGQLKLLGPGANGADPAQHGLGAFVTMTRAERVRRFGQLVGPRVFAIRWQDLAVHTPRSACMLYSEDWMVTTPASYDK